MTSSGTSHQEPDTTTTPPGVCWDCGGPCLTYKGTEHGWRCRTCLAAYIAVGAAAAAARQALERTEIRALLDATAKRGDRRTGGNDGRRPGGGLAAGHVAGSPASLISTRRKYR